ncbi:Elongation of very long chain fatty acids protein 6 [Eumeta japonica]|uniref:Elongation of very long chain fatty acids protein n=1 Tax=Eumeta variegata TaxID=151549 RepID=A0A4C1Z6H0_EUMVA|nr:Elongation of very long chain fatty acids protein 6 [Eumeta japonica]
MYTYYALSSMGYYPPKIFAMSITFLQLTQMIGGCFVNLYAHNYIKASPPGTCHISDINIKLSTAMYFSYFVLFAQFFYKAYLSPKKGKKPIKSDVITKPNKSINDIDTFPRQRNGLVAAH